jgi:lipopolysaccharide/colanic/teichoic acid biosynthesis glycosyltransferase
VILRVGDERAGRASLAATAGPSEKDLADRIEAPHTGGRDPAGGEIGLDRQPGDERHAVSGQHRAPDGFLQPELDADVEIAEAGARLAQLVLDHLAYPRTLLHDDQRLRLQRFQRDGLAREAMTRRTSEHDLVAEERLEDDAPMPAAGTDDAELELPLGDLVDDSLRVGDGKADTEVRMLLLELAQQQGHDGSAGAGRGPELEDAGEGTFFVRRELLEQVLLDGEQPLRGRVEAEPCLGRLDAATRAVEQLPAEPLLERTNLQANGRLRDTEPLGGLGEALPLDDGAERCKLACIHKRSLCSGPTAAGYDPAVATTPRPSESLILRFSELTQASPPRARDLVLRVLDIFLSTLFLLISLPVTLPLALTILATSGRPLFYRGARVGRGGHVFEMLKFRTLRRGAEDRLGPYLGEELVRRTDHETTAIGRWLRATQLDEVPQLWNVVRGDMSLVGPRPIRPRFFEELAAELPAYWQRLVVRPGLTGFAQVRRGYETSMAEKLAHDLEWIADRSVRLYLRTLATTAWRVLGQFMRGLAGRSG